MPLCEHPTRSLEHEFGTKGASDDGRAEQHLNLSDNIYSWKDTKTVEATQIFAPKSGGCVPRFERSAPKNKQKFH
uniref:Uncharacterized protein n=1 Tax=Ascaris lumbricoides TaxID=6252 RepID=A0A0M3I1P8_ASCLU